MLIIKRTRPEQFMTEINEVMHMLKLFFFPKARDLLAWAKETELEMKMDHNVRDVNGADMLRQRHEEIRAEIETRQDTFEEVIATGEALVKNDHYAATEVQCSSAGGWGSYCR